MLDFDYTPTCHAVNQFPFEKDKAPLLALCFGHFRLREAAAWHDCCMLRAFSSRDLFVCPHLCPPSPLTLSKLKPDPVEASAIDLIYLAGHQFTNRRGPGCTMCAFMPAMQDFLRYSIWRKKRDCVFSKKYVSD